MCWISTGHTVQIPQGTYGSQRVQQTQNTLYTNNYSNIEEVSHYWKKKVIFSATSCSGICIREVYFFSFKRLLWRFVSNIFNDSLLIIRHITSNKKKKLPVKLISHAAELILKRGFFVNTHNNINKLFILFILFIVNNTYRISKWTLSNTVYSGKCRSDSLSPNGIWAKRTWSSRAAHTKVRWSRPKCSRNREIRN